MYFKLKYVEGAVPGKPLKKKKDADVAHKSKEYESKRERKLNPSWKHALIFMQPLLCIFESHCHLSVVNIFLSICPSYPSNHTSIKTTQEGINCPFEHHFY